jgi:L-ascorbate metabolism protein UlaG (beta-lactamase superfamily)
MWAMKMLAIMAALFCSQVGASCAAHPSDVIKTRDGGDLRITFFGHGSVGFTYGGRHIYVDPVSDYADYGALPKADLILVGHEHGDHLDPGAIAALSTPTTFVLGNATAVEALGAGTVLEWGEPAQIKAITMDEIYGSGSGDGDDGDPGSMILDEVEAVAAYNTSPEKQGFHPRERRHNGWILTFGGTRVYVAGDTEPIPEMAGLGDIDIAFLPVNLPYTMTEEQAAEAARTIRPAVLYPYHYGGTDHKTDLDKLATLLKDTGIDLRIRPLE